MKSAFNKILYRSRGADYSLDLFLFLFLATRASNSGILKEQNIKRSKTPKLNPVTVLYKELEITQGLVTLITEALLHHGKNQSGSNPVWLQADYQVSIILSFLLCKMKIIRVHILCACEN